MNKYNFDFPNIEGTNHRYWLLFWIGGVSHKGRNIKIDLYFVNKKKADDRITNIDFNLVEIVTTNVAYLSDFKVGCLYDGVKRKIVDNELFTKMYNLNNITRIYTYKTSKSRFPLFGNRFFLKKGEDILGVDYSYQSLFFKSFKEEMQALISPYVWIQFFFKSDRLIERLFKGEILEGLELNTIKYYYDNSSQERIAELFYDKSMFPDNTIFSVVHLLFLVDNLGIRFLNSINSSIRSSFYNNNKSTVYPNVYVKFTDFDIELQGKRIYNKIDDVVKDYFLVSSIKSFRFKKKKNYVIDRVILTPFNSKSSTVDRENHDLEEVVRNADPVPQSTVLILNADEASKISSLDSKIYNDQDFFSYLIIDINDKTKQLASYHVCKAEDNKVIDSLTREIGNLVEDSTALIESINNDVIRREYMSNFDLFQKIIESLGYCKDIDLNRGLLGLRDLNEILNSFGVMIVEVSYMGRFIYLIEFGFTFIGVFSNCNFDRIVNENLINLIKVFKRNVDKANSRSMSLWTYLFNNSRYFEANYKVIIHRGVKRTRESEKNISPINMIADKILKERILKILL